MYRLAQTPGLTEAQSEILDAVRQFVDREVIPVATQLAREDTYPQKIVDGLAELGIFGLMIPEEYGGLGESLLTYALVVEELARGWMSVSGVINTHFIVAYLLLHHGTQEQRKRLLPQMVTGQVRGAFSMSEPGCGSDVSAIRTKAMPDGKDFLVSGQKMWLTNGARSSVVATLVKDDTGAESVYRNMTTFLVEKEPGFGETRPGLTIPGKLAKLGYKGVETTEMLLDGVRLGPDAILGGIEGRGKGFYQMMDGVEVGRVNVAARACGVGIRAFELAAQYSQERTTFGKPIAHHQAIGFKLAEMATKIEASHLMMVAAARLKDSGERNDVQAGMAKLFASEACAEVTQESFRIHGGAGYSADSEIERLMRDAPFLLIGEGTSEIQKMIISRGLLSSYAI
ncbi:MAG: acyl-CoA dehydrogenase family protein [Actinomycetota bacterium]|nr:acyl-CoA dehydrogenase family protein [Actinomycetota bacterium]